MTYYLIIIGLTLVMYLRILPYDYIIDDQLVPKGKGGNWIETFWLQLTARRYSNRYVEHLQRILIHAGVGCLIYYAFGQDEISFMAALMFAVNPVNNNGVAWMNGVGYAMNVVLVLLMIVNPWLGLAAYFFSLWWHVTAFPAPLLYLAGSCIGYHASPWWSLTIFLYVGIAFLAKGKVPFGKVQENATMKYRMAEVIPAFKSINLAKIIFAIKTYTYYHWLTLIPRRLGLYHTFGYAYGLTKKDTDYWSIMSPLFFLGILTIAGQIWAIVYFWGTPLAFGLVWFNIFIAQWCNLIQLHQTISERYCYLPAAGMMISLAYAIHMYLPLEAARLVFACIITAYAVKLTMYLPAYRNMEKYVDMNLQEFPDQFASWNWAGILHREKGRIFSAMYHWAIGLRHNPTSFRLNFNMGMAFRDIGYLDQAQLYLDRAEQGLPPELLEKHKAAIDKEKEVLRQMQGKVAKQRMNIPSDWEKGVSHDTRIVDPFGKGKSKGGIILP